MDDDQENQDKERFLNIGDYTIGDVIGEGRFGTIKKATKNDTGEEFALREFTDTEKTDRDCLREVGVLSKLRYHPAICKFISFSIMPFQILFEYIPNGSLQNILDKLKKGTKPSEWNGTLRSKTIFGVACALHHLHNHDQIHRYLTPKCILFDRNYEPKLTDFIYTRSLDESVQLTAINFKDNLFCRAPEIDSGKYDNKVDCFSFGMVLYCIVSGKIPFSNLKAMKVTSEIEKGARPDIPEDCDPKLKLMILDLWKNNPIDRPSLIDIIKALNNYDTPLFPGTEMEVYKEYRERLIESTYFTEQDREYLQKPSSTKQDIEYFKKTLKLATAGDVESMKKVARMFELGIGTEIDKSDAIKWYQEAANKNDAESLYKIANFYLTDNDVYEIDEDKYMEYLKKSCKLDFHPAICDYAHIVSQTDPNEAIKMLKKIADKPINYKVAQYRLATIYDSQGQVDEAILYYELSQQQDFLPAKADYALFLLEGKEGKTKKITANPRKGIEILKEVAEGGFPMAYFNLGQIYQEGKYVAKNLKEAIKYYQIGAKKGSSASMVILGKAYFRGIFEGRDDIIQKDQIRAARLFEKAAELNDPEGLYSWAKFELYGYGGTVIDVETAIEDLKSSASLNFSQAMYFLYQLLSEGVNGIRDRDTAIKYLIEAKNLEHKEAIEECKKLDL